MQRRSGVPGQPGSLLPLAPDGSGLCIRDGQCDNNTPDPCETGSATSSIPSVVIMAEQNNAASHQAKFISIVATLKSQPVGFYHLSGVKVSITDFLGCNIPYSLGRQGSSLCQGLKDQDCLNSHPLVDSFVRPHSSQLATIRDQAAKHHSRNITGLIPH